MNDTNGTHVTRAELAVHVRRFDERIDELAGDIGEIKGDVGEVKGDVKALRNAKDEADWLGPRGRRVAAMAGAAVLAAVISGSVSLVVALIITGGKL